VLKWKNISEKFGLPQYKNLIEDLIFLVVKAGCVEGWACECKSIVKDS
jgi:hypothetical protein